MPLRSCDLKKTLSKSAPTAQASPSIAVRDLRIKLAPNERLVLYALASRMQSLNSEVWPSMSTIADDTSLSESTARRVVHRLMKTGILVEQINDRRTRTFRLVLPIPVTVTGQPSTMEPLHGDTYPSHGDREGCQPDRVRGVMVTGEVKVEGKSEAEKEDQVSSTALAHAYAPSPVASLTTIESQVLALITSIPELAQAHQDPTAFAKELVFIVGNKKIDLCDKLHRMVKWMRDKQRRMSYARIMQSITDDAAKASTAEPPTIAHVPVDLAQHPELMPPMQQGARFKR